MTTCFGQLTITRPSLQNLEYGTCSANNIYVILDPIGLTTVLKYINNGKRWTVYLACDVLKLFITISKLLRAQTKLKLTYIIHFKWIIYVNFNLVSASISLLIIIQTSIRHRLKNRSSYIVFNILLYGCKYYGIPYCMNVICTACTVFWVL